jgi:hypothetical protein
MNEAIASGHCVVAIDMLVIADLPENSSQKLEEVTELLSKAANFMGSPNR